MRRSRLNLSALRARRLPRLPRAGFSAIDLLDNQSRFSLTRREMLGLAGTAAATLPLKLGTPEGRVQLVPGAKRVAFRLDGRDRWVIDTRRFAGTPVLHLEQSRDLVRVALANARYPGTELPADLECRLERVGAGWRMHLRMALGGFHGEAPFERWLLGKAELRSAVQLDKAVKGPGDSSSLLLAGHARAEFLPNWTLRLTGKRIARLRGFGGETVSDQVVIALLEGGEPSIFRKPSERRTLLAMNRNGRPWPFQPFLGRENTRSVVVSDTAFDRIRIETGENTAGASSTALVAESQSGQPGVAYTPDGKFGASDGKPFRLPLRNARYAIATDAAGQHSALVANYAAQPTWIHAEGCSFEVGDSADAPAFEAVSVNGQPPRIRCAPALKQIAAPLPGVIVQARPLSEGTQLAFLMPPQTERKQIILRNLQKIEKKEQPKKEKRKNPVRLQVRPTKKKVRVLAAPARTNGTTETRSPEGGTRLRIPPRELGTHGRISVAPQTHPVEGGTQLQTPSRELGTPSRLPRGRINVAVPVPQRNGNISPNPVVRPSSEQSLSFDIIRPEDLLVLTFDFFNMTISAGQGAPTLVRVDPNQPAYLVVQFGPQHIAEEAFWEYDKPKPLPNTAAPPIMSRLAGGSRLAFIVPDTVAEIPYQLESLLDWSQFEQSVTPLATPPRPLYIGMGTNAGRSKAIREPQVQVIQSSPDYYQQVQPSVISPQPVVANGKKKKNNKKGRQEAMLAQSEMARPSLFELQRLKAPEAFQTSLEVPYRIILSPSYYAGWAHSAKAVQHGGAFELWHTRLGVRSQQGMVDEQSDFYRTVRAVWATDYPGGCLSNLVKDPGPFTFPTITQNQRYQIVRLSSDPNIVYKTNQGQANYVPQPIQVNRLMLTTMGAWLNSEGTWNLTEDVIEPSCGTGHFTFGLESWRHIAAMGRDQYVRIVERGFLFPFGHRAVKITITERKFNRTPSGDMAAYLRQQAFVVVREHEKNYPATGQPHPQGPQLPFQTVYIDTLSTPALDPPAPVVAGGNAFWPRVDNQDFEFKMRGVDWEGKTSEFTAPLIFMGVDEGRDIGRSEKIMAYYNTDPQISRRSRSFFGQKVAYAKNKVVGDTTLETDTLSFKGQVPAAGTNLPQGMPYFYPAVALAAVRIATVEQLTGRNAATYIKYHASYLDHGIESAANQGQVFAELLSSVPLAFGGSGGGADKVGGLLTPSMDITGLSRLLGPVAGDLATIVGGAFDPKQFFKSALDAKLLGDISLGDVITSVSNFSSAVEKVPKFVTSHLPNAIETSFTWQPEIQDVSAESGKPAFFKVTGDKTNALTVNATLRKTLDNKPPTYKVSAVMTGFELHLVPSVVEVLVVRFKELSFTSENGKKPDVNADLAGVDFIGPLSFVNALKDLIPTDGFKDPPSLSVTADGIEAGYSLGLPPVSLGMFNLSNVSLAAQLNIYFTGKPITFQFDFCQEQQPFLLTVSLFGGGGYFGLTLTPAGIQKMAAEFEFGGSFSLNLGVASGGVYVMAGFSYQHSNGNTELTGYLRCGGALEVLAIITVSVEFKMGLKYVSDGNKLWGRATLTVEVKVLFFSKSVDLTVERQFAGGGTQNAALFEPGAPYPVGPTPVHFADQMNSTDWQLYCEAFA